MAECWDLYREALVIVSDRVQKQAAKFATRTNKSVRITLVQLRKIALIWAPFNLYIAERAWNATGENLQGLCYLSKEDFNRKIRGRKKIQILGNILL